MGAPGAILLSSIAWTALHLQYDWFFFAEVFSIGLLFGYIRYRTDSTWLTIVLHGLNNLAATLQTIFLTQLTYCTSAITIGIVIAARIVCSVMICASSGASPPICRAST